MGQYAACGFDDLVCLVLGRQLQIQQKPDPGKQQDVKQKLVCCAHGTPDASHTADRPKQTHTRTERLVLYAG